MVTSDTAIYVQPLLIFRNRHLRFTAPGSTTEPTMSPSSGTTSFISGQSSAQTTQEASRDAPFISKVFSSVPAVNALQLVRDYQDLGLALDQLQEVGDNEAWKIEAPVYEAARRLGAELLNHNYPVPHIFSHGPKSVVFTWSKGDSTIYVTISADRLSALVSTPARITKRLVYSPEALLSHSRAPLLTYAPGLDEPTLVTTKAGSEPLQMAG